jgi:hypothetical protein
MRAGISFYPCLARHDVIASRDEHVAPQVILVWLFAAYYPLMQIATPNIANILYSLVGHRHHLGRFF